MKKYKRSKEGEARRIEAVKKACMGKKHSEEHKKKAVETRMKNGSYIAWNKGIKMDLEKYPTYGMNGKKHLETTKEKIIKKNKGKHFSPKTEFKKGCTPWHKGKKGVSCGTLKGTKFSEERIKQMSESRKGDKSHTWKGGVTSKNKLLRASTRWKKWRKEVFERDNYSCRDCGIRNGDHHPHHLFPVSKCIEQKKEHKVFDINNGRTLCVPCHKKEHNGSFG